MVTSLFSKFQELEKALEKNALLKDAYCIFEPLELNPYLQGILDELPSSIGNVYKQLIQADVIWSYTEDDVEVNGGACKLSRLTELKGDQSMKGLGEELESYYEEFLNLLVVSSSQSSLDSIYLLESKMGLGSQEYIIWVSTESKPAGGLWYWRSDGAKLPLSIDFETYIAQVLQTKGQFHWEYFFIDWDEYKTVSTKLDDDFSVYPDAMIREMEHYLTLADRLFPGEDREGLKTALETFQNKVNA